MAVNLIKAKIKAMLPGTVVNYFTKGASRSVKVKKNIAFSLVIRCLNIAISFLLVPLTINYVNPTQYGIWLTLSSIVAWFSFFDIGFGNGLRNKFAEAVALGKHKLARIYVSTTYAILSIVIGIVLVLFFVINPFLDWSKILNTPPEMAQELSILALLVFVFFCLQFVLQLINVVLTANQEPAKAAAFKFYTNVLSLAIIFVLTKTTEGDLVKLGIALGVTPVLALTCANFFFYQNKYKCYTPTLRYVNLKYARSLMKIGTKFFVLQIGAIVLFQTNSIIIAQLLGPLKVTVYQIVSKYFGAVLLIFNIIMTPFWSAFTDAWANNDIVWIKRIVKKLQALWIWLSLLAIVILVLSEKMYTLWIGNSVSIPHRLSIVMAVSAILQMWQSIYLQFVNGISKISLQFWLVIFTSIFNIPLAIWLGSIYGLEGIATASVIIFLFLGITMFYQTHKILNGKANGIWNK